MGHRGAGPPTTGAPGAHDGGGGSRRAVDGGEFAHRSVPLVVMAVLTGSVAAIVGSGSNLDQIELVVLGVVVLLAVLLIAVRATRSRRQKLRKAASTGYFDLDVARYGPDAVPGPEDVPAGQADQPLAPTFTAPRGRRNAPTGSGRVDPTPGPTGPLDATRRSTDPIPPFMPRAPSGPAGAAPPTDPPAPPATSAPAPAPTPGAAPTVPPPPPPSSTPLASPPPVPVPSSPSPTPSPTPPPTPSSTLPLLEQPPPPAQRPSPDHS